MLVGGDWQGAMGKINALRMAAGVEPAMATNTAEAWTALKFERGVVLWLEGRRLGDFFRWNRDNTPGAPARAGNSRRGTRTRARTSSSRTSASRYRAVRSTRT